MVRVTCRYTDPVGRLLFNVLTMVAEFEAHLTRMRTREGMKVAKAKGRLRGKQPKLSPKQEAHLVALHSAVSTRSASSRSCSLSPARRFTGPSDAVSPARRPDDRETAVWMLAELTSAR